MTVGELIKKNRLEKGLTQKQLGEMANIAEPTIRRYELGKLNPKYETIQKIADALQIPAFELMEPASLFSFSHSEGHLKLNPITDEDSTIEDKRLDSIIENYHQLNEEGKEALADRAEEMTYIPKYKKRDPASDEEVG